MSYIQISVASFTSIEAAAMGLPIIIVRPDNKMNFFSHFGEDIDIRVINKRDIVYSIDLARSNKYWKQFLNKREKYFKKVLFSTDSHSAQRVANVIKSLIKT